MQENKKSAVNKTMCQKPYQRNEYMGCTTCKIFSTILVLEQRRTKANGPEKKK